MVANQLKWLDCNWLPGFGGGELEAVAGHVEQQRGKHGQEVCVRIGQVAGLDCEEVAGAAGAHGVRGVHFDAVRRVVAQVVDVDPVLVDGLHAHTGRVQIWVIAIKTNNWITKYITNYFELCNWYYQLK